MQEAPVSDLLENSDLESPSSPERECERCNEWYALTDDDWKSRVASVVNKMKSTQMNVHQFLNGADVRKVHGHYSLTIFIISPRSLSFIYPTPASPPLPPKM